MGLKINTKIGVINIKIITPIGSVKSSLLNCSDTIIRESLDQISFIKIDYIFKIIFLNGIGIKLLLVNLL
jgi:hypothetical protein